jgi:hypothetical protein
MQLTRLSPGGDGHPHGCEHCLSHPLATDPASLHTLPVWESLLRAMMKSHQGLAGDSGQGLQVTAVASHVLGSQQFFFPNVSC